MRWVIAGIIAAAVVLATAVAVLTTAWAAGRGTRDGQDTEAPYARQDQRRAKIS